MSVAYAGAGPRSGLVISGSRIGDLTVGGITFLGGFVIYEPAPYELLLVPVILVWAAVGLKLNRHVAPLAALLVLYIAGGMLAVPQSTLVAKAAVHLATTVFLALSAIFFAAVIATAAERRLRVIAKAYIASAVITALCGILGYAGVLPHGELFTLYGRARGVFQDPNVFGPFLILPILVLAQRVLTTPLRSNMWALLWIAIILLGLFLSFSRAAWGMTVAGIMLMALFTFINQRRNADRLRIIVYLGVGVVLAALLLAAVLSIPAVDSLFNERAQLVQSYDAGRLGRFERHILGLHLVLEKPLGIGPFVFGQTFGEDEHNMWLKGFTVYGWIGGFAYLILIAWTLAAVTPLVFKSSPWRDFLVCTYAAFLVHLIVHFVIDQDHWRHFFLYLGIIWGCIAANRLERRRRILATREFAGVRPLPA